MGRVKMSQIWLLSWLTILTGLHSSQQSGMMPPPIPVTTQTSLEVITSNGIGAAHNGQVCSTWGNFHYSTYDGDFFQLPYQCNYILTTMCDSSQSDFNIQMRRELVENIPVITIFTIKLDGIVVMLHKGKITVNDKPLTIPGYYSGLRIEKMTNYIKMSSKIGVTVFWDEDNSLSIEMSANYKNKTCGLCGDFNGILNNEFIENGQKLTPDDIGFKWKMDSPTEKCEQTLANAQDNCEIQRNKCHELLYHPAFDQCHNLLNTNVYLEACVQDMCQCNSSANYCLCDTLSEFSRQCAHAGGQPKDWRSKDFCGVKCPLNMVHSECGSPCVDTCSNQEGTQLCADHCVDGCICPPGTVLDDIENNGCIPADKCSCTHNGKTYQPGESFTRTCQECVCSQGRWNCTNQDCPGTCSLLGGSHVTSYDSKAYSFHGNCDYILSKDNASDVTVLAHLAQCGTSETETCLTSVKIITSTHTATITSTGNLILNNVATKLPIVTEKMTMFKPSTFYIITHTRRLKVAVQLVPIMQVHLTATSDQRNKMSGLCGNFNDMQADDFQTQSGLIEGTALTFASTWKVTMCQDFSINLMDPCTMSVEKEKYAKGWCGMLSNPEGPFSRCHSEVNPKDYVQRCTYDACACSQSEECMCGAVSSYVYACAARGVMLNGWRDSICNTFTKNCPGKMVYSYDQTSCQSTCRSLSETDHTCQLSYTPVDGCACPENTYLNDMNECVPSSECPCYTDNEIVAPMQVISKEGTTCTCRDGKLRCSGQQEVTSCTAPMVYFNCDEAEHGKTGTECQKSCQTVDLNTCISTQCKSGCVCPDGLLADGKGGCVKEEQCPCVHNGDFYNPGESVRADCNNCTCKNRKWECTKKECHSMCTIYGDSHYISFDGKRYTFNGNCEYVLAQDYCDNSNAGSFRIITENIPCGTTGTTCSKAIKIFLGNKQLLLSEENIKSVQQNDSQEIPYKVHTVGIYMVIEAQNSLTVFWDRKTSLMIKLGPKFKSQVCGLCGNYDGDWNNDFMTRGGEEVAKPTEFGNSWRVSPNCPESSGPLSPCSMRPYREAWATKQCSILKSDVFSSCLSVVDPSPYYDACVRDTCACDAGGDCECFCTSVAAYAAACSRQGVCIMWRSPTICPLFCDYYNSNEGCEWHYKPCGQSCMKTCRNTDGVCYNEMPPLEGCFPQCPSDRPYLEEATMKCVSRKECGCYVDETNTHYNVGDRIPSKERCTECYCTDQGASCNYSKNACFCEYMGRIYKTGEIIYDTTDGDGACINATCQEDGTIRRKMVFCTTPPPPTTPTTSAPSTATPTTVFVFTSTKTPTLSTTVETASTLKSSTASVHTTTSTSGSTPESTTTKTPSSTTPYSCQPCQWSDWLDNSYPPSAPDGEEIESIPKLWKSGKISCEEPEGIECRATEYRDVSLIDLDQMVICNAIDGLICKNKNQTDRKCLNFEIRVKCCDEHEHCPPTTTSTSRRTPEISTTTKETSRTTTGPSVSTPPPSETTKITSVVPTTTTKIIDTTKGEIPRTTTGPSVSTPPPSETTKITEVPTTTTKIIDTTKGEIPRTTTGPSVSTPPPSETTKITSVVPTTTTKIIDTTKGEIPRTTTGPSVSTPPPSETTKITSVVPTTTTKIIDTTKGEIPRTTTGPSVSTPPPSETTKITEVPTTTTKIIDTTKGEIPRTTTGPSVSTPPPSETTKITSVVPTTTTKIIDTTKGEIPRTTTGPSVSTPPPSETTKITSVVPTTTTKIIDTTKGEIPRTTTGPSVSTPPPSETTKITEVPTTTTKIIDTTKGEIPRTTTGPSVSTPPPSETTKKTEVPTTTTKIIDTTKGEIPRTTTGPSVSTPPPSETTKITSVVPTTTTKIIDTTKGEIPRTTTGPSVSTPPPSETTKITSVVPTTTTKIIDTTKGEIPRTTTGPSVSTPPPSETTKITSVVPTTTTKIIDTTKGEIPRTTTGPSVSTPPPSETTKITEVPTTTTKIIDTTKGEIPRTTTGPSVSTPPPSETTKKTEVPTTTTKIIDTTKGEIPRTTTGPSVSTPPPSETTKITSVVPTTTTKIIGTTTGEIPRTTTGPTESSSTTETVSTSATTPYSCQPCQWSDWLDDSYPPSTPDGEEIESISKLWKSGKISCEEPEGIECRATEYRDVSLIDLDQMVICNAIDGLICKNKNQTDHKCFNFEIRVKCCDEHCTPTTTSTSRRTPEISITTKHTISTTSKETSGTTTGPSVSSTPPPSETTKITSEVPTTTTKIIDTTKGEIPRTTTGPSVSTPPSETTKKTEVPTTTTKIIDTTKGEIPRTTTGPSVSTPPPSETTKITSVVPTTTTKIIGTTKGEIPRTTTGPSVSTPPPSETTKITEVPTTTTKIIDTTKGEIPRTTAGPSVSTPPPSETTKITSVVPTTTTKIIDTTKGEIPRTTTGPSVSTPPPSETTKITSVVPTTTTKIIDTTKGEIPRTTTGPSVSTPPPSETTKKTEVPTTTTKIIDTTKGEIPRTTTGPSVSTPPSETTKTTSVVPTTTTKIISTTTGEIPRTTTGPSVSTPPPSETTKITSVVPTTTTKIIGTTTGEIPRTTTGPTESSSTTETVSTSATTPYSCQPCQFSDWLDDSYPPSTPDGEEIESISKLWKSGKISCEEPEGIECRATEYRDVSLIDLDQMVICNAIDGLICKNKNQTDRKCLNFEIRVKCCDEHCTPTTTSTSRRTPEISITTKHTISTTSKETSGTTTGPSVSSTPPPSETTKITSEVPTTTTKIIDTTKGEIPRTTTGPSVSTPPPSETTKITEVPTTTTKIIDTTKGEIPRTTTGPSVSTPPPSETTKITSVVPTTTTKIIVTTKGEIPRTTTGPSVSTPPPSETTKKTEVPTTTTKIIDTTKGEIPRTTTGPSVSTPPPSETTKITSVVPTTTTKIIVTTKGEIPRTTTGPSVSTPPPSETTKKTEVPTTTTKIIDTTKGEIPRTTTGPSVSTPPPSETTKTTSVVPTTTTKIIDTTKGEIPRTTTGPSVSTPPPSETTKITSVVPTTTTKIIDTTKGEIPRTTTGPSVSTPPPSETTKKTEVPTTTTKIIDTTKGEIPRTTTGPSVSTPPPSETTKITSVVPTTTTKIIDTTKGEIPRTTTGPSVSTPPPSETTKITSVVPTTTTKIIDTTKGEIPRTTTGPSVSTPPPSETTKITSVVPTTTTKIIDTTKGEIPRTTTGPSVSTPPPSETTKITSVVPTTTTKIIDTTKGEIPRTTTGPSVSTPPPSETTKITEVPTTTTKIIDTTKGEIPRTTTGPSVSTPPPSETTKKTEVPTTTTKIIDTTKGEIPRTTTGPSVSTPPPSETTKITSVVPTTTTKIIVTTKGEIPRTTTGPSVSTPPPSETTKTTSVVPTTTTKIIDTTKGEIPRTTTGPSVSTPPPSETTKITSVVPTTTTKIIDTTKGEIPRTTTGPSVSTPPPSETTKKTEVPTTTTKIIDTTKGEIPRTTTGPSVSTPPPSETTKITSVVPTTTTKIIDTTKGEIPRTTTGPSVSTPPPSETTKITSVVPTTTTKIIDTTKGEIPRTTTGPSVSTPPPSETTKITEVPTTTTKIIDTTKGEIPRTTTGPSVSTPPPSETTKITSVVPTTTTKIIVTTKGEIPRTTTGPSVSTPPPSETTKITEVPTTTTKIIDTTKGEIPRTTTGPSVSTPPPSETTKITSVVPTTTTKIIGTTKGEIPRTTTGPSVSTPPPSETTKITSVVPTTTTKIIDTTKGEIPRTTTGPSVSTPPPSETTKITSVVPTTTTKIIGTTKGEIPRTTTGPSVSTPPPSETTKITEVPTTTTKIIDTTKGEIPRTTTGPSVSTPPPSETTKITSVVPTTTTKIIVTTKGEIPRTTTGPSVSTPPPSETTKITSVVPTTTTKIIDTTKGEIPRTTTGPSVSTPPPSETTKITSVVPTTTTKTIGTTTKTITETKTTSPTETTKKTPPVTTESASTPIVKPTSTTTGPSVSSTTPTTTITSVILPTSSNGTTLVVRTQPPVTPTAHPQISITQISTSHSSTTQSSTATSTTTGTTTPCFCKYNEQIFQPGSVIYNRTDGAGWCFTSYCDSTCNVYKNSMPCVTTPAPSTSSPKPTTTPTSTPTATPPPIRHCTYLNPPRQNDEHWTEGCSDKLCKDGSVISTPVQCGNSEPVMPQCVNGVPPVKVYDKSGCCYHYECQCKCYGWGDPHYVTFDGEYYAFQGNCTYVLVQEINKKYNFSVHIKNYICDAAQGLACPDYLTIYYKSYKIDLRQSRNPTVNKVFVNNQQKTPIYSNADFTITTTVIAMTLDIPAIQAQVVFKGMNFVISLPYSIFHNNTVGQCGKCDNDTVTDCLMPNGKLSDSCTEMAPKWQVNDTLCPSPPTNPPPTAPPSTCKPPICDIIFSKVFESCHKVIDPKVFYDACVYDVCLMKNSTGCFSLQSYAQMCAGENICVDWRGSTRGQCAPNCPSNKVYRPCGPKMEPTCNSMVNDKLINCNSSVCQDSIREGCFCPNGTTLFSVSTDICTSFCGCTGPDGQPKQPGDKWVSECNECTCSKTSMGPVCQPITCSKPEACNKMGYELKTVDCCPKCVCNSSLCPTAIPKCPPGYELVQNKSDSDCCVTFTCKPKNVCVYSGQEYKTGEKVQTDTCEDCVCGSTMNPNTKLLDVKCTPIQCNTACSKGFSYQPVAGKCCGNCVQTQCIYDNGGSGSNVTMVEVGQSWTNPSEPCMKYNCTKVKDTFVLVKIPPSCDKYNAEDCIPGTEQTTSDGCCKTCQPRNCRVLKNTTRLEVDNCVSVNPVEMASCSGSCDTSSIYSTVANSMMHNCSCCQERRTSIKEVQLKCANNTQKPYKYTYVEECGCSVTKCT